MRSGDTSVVGAYWANPDVVWKRVISSWGVLRGIHRYSADGFLFLSVIHLVREWARGHHRGVRWFPWVSEYRFWPCLDRRYYGFLAAMGFASAVQRDGHSGMDSSIAWVHLICSRATFSRHSR